MVRITIACTILATASTAVAAEHTAASARAGDLHERAESEQIHENVGESAAVDAAARGALTPFSLSPDVPRAGTGLALGGYDGAANAFRARSAVDGRLLDFLAARVEYEHGPANGSPDRVSLGLRAKLLNQAAHGVELGVLAFYQPRDFRGEADVVGGVLLARRFDRLTLVLNPLVGSDPEGDDRSFELRLAGLYKANSWLVIGLDSRGRYNLSTDTKRVGQSSLDWEAQAGAAAAFCVGPVSFSTLLGPSLLQRSDPGLDGGSGQRQLRGGLLAMAGAGATF